MSLPIGHKCYLRQRLGSPCPRPFLDERSTPIAELSSSRTSRKRDRVRPLALTVQDGPSVKAPSPPSTSSLRPLSPIARGICLIAVLIFNASCNADTSKGQLSGGSIPGLGNNESVENTRTLTLSNGTTLRLQMVDLPGGEFQMGGTQYDNEKPVHRVRIAPFSIGKFEVTRAEWSTVMGNNPSYFKGETRPVENVSWHDVQEFLKRLGNGYRLPSEAEWEYAARGGTTTEYSFGDDESKLGDYAWFYGNSGGETHPVGQKRPNPFGLHDVHGNVWEWVEDTVHENYVGAPTDGSAWRDDGDNLDRMMRGGAWFDISYYRSANRANIRPANRGYDVGFRLAAPAATRRAR